jgi:solute carrier family 66 (lysosomal lysine-arginine transporter), member 1
MDMHNALPYLSAASNMEERKQRAYHLVYQSSRSSFQYVRKSVEGLSIYLFIFAWLGNVFYVSSILSSPNMSLPAPEAAAFLRESLPYLLGSGGTLMFGSSWHASHREPAGLHSDRYADITIVFQSIYYTRRAAHKRGRSSSTAHPEEQAGLLAGAQD